jgi:hypothetical protein
MFLIFINGKVSERLHHLGIVHYKQIIAFHSILAYVRSIKVVPMALFDQRSTLFISILVC